MADYIIPFILLTAAGWGLRKRLNVYSLLAEGAAEGFSILRSIAPNLIILMSAVAMLRSSGAIEMLSGFLKPAFGVLGIPPETAILVLIRPISGSAALAVGAEIMKEYGVDSLAGRTAAVMLGSTETTFYAISVYFGAAGVKKTRYAVPAALIADFCGFVVASLTAKYL